MKPNIALSMRTQTSSPRIFKTIQDLKISNNYYFDNGIKYIQNGSPTHQDEKLINELVNQYFSFCHGLIIPGNDANIDPRFYNPGEKPPLDTPENRRIALEIALVKKALQLGVPVLGICGGHQVIAVALGMKLDNVENLKQAAAENASFNQVIFCSNTMLHRLIQPKEPHNETKELHQDDDILKQQFLAFKQAIVPEPSDFLKIAAYSPDALVMAYEVNGHPFLVGTQFHPEMNNVRSGEFDHNSEIFKVFITTCAKVAEVKQQKVAVHQELNTLFAQKKTAHQGFSSNEELGKAREAESTPPPKP